MKTVNVGVIGGGLMGKEVASAFGRWFVLQESPVTPRLVAVADPNETALSWFARVPGLELSTSNYEELLRHPGLDVVYLAVPHKLHGELAASVIESGKDLLAEKPFGIDLESASRLQASAEASGRFVRISSEFPFYPGAQAVYESMKSTNMGDLLEVDSAFLHSSDLDTNKPINWKRQVSECGQAGVMNDLGLHVVHLPFRLGLVPRKVYAQLQNVVQIRPDGHGGSAVCDTWDNATLHCTLDNDVPMRLQMKRLAPGQMNTWSIKILGTKGGVKYSTKWPKSLFVFDGRDWITRDVGHVTGHPVVTGGIFEFGFPDALLQMWAAFFAEREGTLGGRFACATPDEALLSHKLWAAAQESHSSGSSKGVL